MWGEQPIRARLLGEPTFRWGDVKIAPPSRKTGSLLLALCLRSDGLERPDIAELLWGVGRTQNVRQALYVLRRLPGVEAWLDPGDPVRVAADADVERFASAVQAGRYAEALDLWRVPPSRLWRREILEGPGAFADWLAVERERMEAAYLECLQCRAVELEDGREPERALTVVEALLEADPLNESAHRSAIRLELELGRPAVALERYEACRRALLEELGVEPLERTQALVAALVGPATARLDVASSDVGLRAQAGRRTPFIGRQEELARLAAALMDREALLVNVVGEGGSGKTRLALELADRSAADYPDGAAVAALAPVRDGSALPSTIARAVGVLLDGSRDAQAQLVSALGPRRMLLVVDNLEHMIHASGLLVTLAEECPGVRVVCTSREPIGAAGEQVLRLRGLRVPASVGDADWERAEAVRLFEATARRSLPRFRLDEAARPGVQRILELVEGLPLAVELAAPWVRSLAPSEIADELERSVVALRDATGEGPERHGSMSAAFEHSWGLLPDDERDALARVSVFRGPFAREAAEAVAGAGLRTLLALDRKSLLRRADGGRFGMSEVVRSAAWPRVGDPSEVEARHARYLAERIGGLEPWVDGPRMGAAMAALERDLDDVRAAWSWAAARGDADVLRRLLTPFHRYLDTHGLSTEGERSFRDATDAVDASAHPELHAMLAARRARFALALGAWDGWPERMDEATRVLLDAGAAGEASFAASTGAFACYYAGDPDAARARFRRALALAERGGDEGRQAWARVGLGTVALAHGDFEEAREHAAASLALARACGDAYAEARALIHLGIALAAGRGHREGLETLQEAVSACRALGEQSMLASALNNLSRAQQQLGDLDGALTSLRECAELRERVGDPRGAALAYANLGHLHHERGDLAAGRRWLERGRDGFARLGNELGLALADNRLGRLAWNEGRVDDALAVYASALDHAVACGDQPQQGDVLAGIGYLAQDAGRRARAVGLYALVRANLHEKGFTRDDLEARLRALKASMPAPSFARAACWGESARFDRVVARERRRAAGAGPGGPPEGGGAGT